LIKTDYQGNIIWTKEGNFYPRALDESNVYSIIFDSLSLGILKTDSAGNMIWAKNLSASVRPLMPGNINGIGDLVLNGDRIYILSCQYNPVTTNNEYSAVLTIDTAGNYVNSWCDQNNFGPFIYKGFKSRTGCWDIYREPPLTSEESYGLLDHDGNYDSVGYSSFLGFALSSRTIDIIELPDSGYIAAAYLYSGIVANPSSAQIVIMKLNENGSPSWVRRIHSIPNSDTAYSVNAVTCDSVGNLYGLGSFNANFTSDNGIIAFKIDTSGNFLFTKRLMIPGNIGFMKIHYKNGSLICGGQCKVNTTYYPVIFELDTAFNGCFVTSSAFPLPIYYDTISSVLQGGNIVQGYAITMDTITITTIANTQTFDYCLELSSDNIIENHSSVSPNPFTEIIKIRSKLEKTGMLSVYNLLGEKVYESVFNSDLELNLSGLKPGVYIFELKLETNMEVKKVIKL